MSAGPRTGTQVANGARLKISCFVLRRFESCPVHSTFSAPRGRRLVGVLVRYGEIGVKSPPVRRQMEARLRQNLEDALLRRRIEGHVATLGPRLWMTGPDDVAMLDVATHTFGVVSASRMQLVGASMAEIGAAAAHLALQRPWTRFAVRASRSGQHDFSSQDIGVQVGSAIFTAAADAGRQPVVDLDTPELEVLVEVREDRAYVGFEKVAGPGGLPAGSQGTVVALLSDRASAVAAWLMMRRGCRVIALHAGDMGSAPLPLLEPLWRWGLPADVELLPVCSGSVGKDTLLAAAAAVARQHGAEALVTGDTLDSTLIAPPDTVVLRPVCGLEPDELERIAATIGLGDEETPRILAADSSETIESLLSMRRTVSA